MSGPSGDGEGLSKALDRRRTDPKRPTLIRPRTLRGCSFDLLLDPLSVGSTTPRPDPRGGIDPNQSVRQGFGLQPIPLVINITQSGKLERLSGDDFRDIAGDRKSYTRTGRSQLPIRT